MTKIITTDHPYTTLVMSTPFTTTTTARPPHAQHKQKNFFLTIMQRLRFDRWLTPCRTVWSAHPLQKRNYVANWAQKYTLSGGRRPLLLNEKKKQPILVFFRGAATLRNWCNCKRHQNMSLVCVSLTPKMCAHFSIQAMFCSTFDFDEVVSQRVRVSVPSIWINVGLN